MRITPTREQMAYLASIGVTEETLSQPVRASEPADTGLQAERGDHSAWGLARTWLAIIALLVALIACSGIAMGEDLQSLPPSQAPKNEPAARDDSTAHVPLTALERHLDTVVKEYPRDAQPGRDAERSLSGQQRELREETRPQASSATPGFVLLVVVASLFAYLLRGRMLMERRLTQLETETLAGATGIPAEGIRVVSGDQGEKPMAGLVASVDPGVKPKRPDREPPPKTPGQAMEVIIQQCAVRFKHYRVKPRHPDGPWTMGLATGKGNVRSENQDFGLAFRLDDGHDVLIVADGLGGVPMGGCAARIASATAAASVLHTYGMATRLHTPHVRVAAAKAITEAAQRLAVEGDKRNLFDLRGGLRTTLIVLIGNKQEIGYAYIGDGGGCVVRASGEIERFLVPQKADDLGMNVLAASLGPTTDGEFVAGTIKRAAGDLVLVGSDGVFDRIGPEFPKDVLRGCIQSRGDLQATAHDIIEELAAFKDNLGYVCDDNLTLGLMGDGTSPRLAQGFWSTTPPSNVATEPPAKSAKPMKEVPR